MGGEPPEHGRVPGRRCFEATGVTGANEKQQLCASKLCGKEMGVGIERFERIELANNDHFRYHDAAQFGRPVVFFKKSLLETPHGVEVKLP